MKKKKKESKKLVFICYIENRNSIISIVIRRLVESFKSQTNASKCLFVLFSLLNSSSVNPTAILEGILNSEQWCSLIDYLYFHLSNWSFRWECASINNLAMKQLHPTTAPRFLKMHFLKLKKKNLLSYLFSYIKACAIMKYPSLI